MKTFSTLVFLLFSLSVYAQSPVAVVAPTETQSGLAILERANALYLSGRFAQSILMYRKAEQRGADPVASAFNTGNSYFQLEKLPEAAAAFRKAVRVSQGTFAPALFNLAAVLYRLGAYADCIATYHRALRLDDSNTSAWLYLAEAYNKTGDVVGAQRALENARRLDPEDISVTYQLAEVHLALSEVDVAANIVREGYARHPQEVDFLIYLGDLYRSVNRYDDAAAAWREALVIQADNTELMYKIADALAESNSTFLAMDYLGRALQIKPQFSDAAIFLGNLAFDTQWWDRAERAYIQAGDAGNPEAIQGLRNLAYEFDQKKLTDQAVVYLQSALRYAPQDLALRAEIEDMEQRLSE